MSAPLHAASCPCHSCHTQRNPRALAPAMGPVVLAPEPLYPRGPDNTSDSTDAEMDRLRQRIAEMETENTNLCARVKRLKDVADQLFPLLASLRAHANQSCGCDPRDRCDERAEEEVDEAANLLKGVM